MSEQSRKIVAPSYDPLALEAPLKGDIISYQDSFCYYLRLKVTSTSRSWYFDRSVDGVHLKRKIGAAEFIGLIEARLQAFEWAKTLEVGGKIQTKSEMRKEVLRKTMTIGRIFAIYNDEHLEPDQVSTRDEIKKGFARYWAALKNVEIADATNELNDWLNKLRTKSGIATANKQLTIFKAAVKWCADRGYVDYPPTLNSFKRFREERREEYLKKEQVPAFAEALEHEPQYVQDIFWLMLWTSQRKSNVLAMEWNEIDWNQQQWIIPAHKTKSKKPYAVALTQPAIDILRSRRDCHARWVFPAPASGSGHVENIHTAWARIKSRAQLGALVPHSLRHTGATWLAQSGANAFEIQRHMQHGSIATSQRYVHMVSSNVLSIVTRSQRMGEG